PANGVKVAVHNAPAPAAILQHLVIAHPFLRAAVVIRLSGQTILRFCLDIGFGNEETRADFAYVHGRLLAAHGTAWCLLTSRPVFQLLEVRFDIRPRPALGSHTCPSVVVLGNAANVDHAIDEGGTAYALATRHGNGAALRRFFRLCFEAPVERLVRHELAETCRNADPGVPPFAAGFKKQNGVATVGGEPVREYAAGSAATHNDVVVLGACCAA